MSCEPRRCVTFSPMPPEPVGSEVLAGFQALTFDPEQCRQDLAAFEVLLASAPELAPPYYLRRVTGYECLCILSSALSSVAPSTIAWAINRRSNGSLCVGYIGKFCSANT